MTIYGFVYIYIWLLWWGGYSQYSLIYPLQCVCRASPATLEILPLVPPLC